MAKAFGSIVGLAMVASLFSVAARADEASPSGRGADVAVKDALLRHDAPTVDLSAAAAARSPTPAPSKTSSTPVDAGPRLSSIGSTAGEAKTAAGSATDARPDTGSAPQGPKPVAGVRVLRRMNADRVLASLQEPFRACYVEANSRSRGSAVLRVSTNGKGEVESVEIVSTSMLPLGLVDCTARRVRAVKFGAPGGGGYSLLVPVVFAP